MRCQRQPRAESNSVKKRREGDGHNVAFVRTPFPTTKYRVSGGGGGGLMPSSCVRLERCRHGNATYPPLLSNPRRREGCTARRSMTRRARELEVVMATLQWLPDEFSIKKERGEKKKKLVRPPRYQSSKPLGSARRLGRPRRRSCPSQRNSMSSKCRIRRHSSSSSSFGGCLDELLSLLGDDINVDSVCCCCCCVVVLHNKSHLS